MRKDATRGEALRMLAQGERFGAELNVSPDDLEWLRAGGWQSDERALRSYLRQKAGRLALGRARMRLELAERGADPEVVEAVLAELPPEEERARALLAAHHREDDAKARRFLARRGFELDE